VPSVEPFSTTITSASRPSSLPASARSVASMAGALVYAETT
jgi:hypothetical protein